MARNDGTSGHCANSLEKNPNAPAKAEREEPSEPSTSRFFPERRCCDASRKTPPTETKDFASFEPRARRERGRRRSGRGDAETCAFFARVPPCRARSMKLKQLESLLQDVEPFREPNQMLEQYPTGAHLASRVVAAAHEHGDIEDRAVVDLGVGGGVLTIASLLMGAKKVTGLDLDPNALSLTRENCAAFDPPLEPDLFEARIPRDILKARRGVTREEIRSVDERDASSVGERDEDLPRRSDAETTIEAETSKEKRDDDETSDETSDATKKPKPNPFRVLRADTVVMNPPFGTRKKGADMGFLRAGLLIARNAVYSLNKTSTRAHIEKHALRTLRARSATVLAELRYELPKTYAHHRKEVVTIEVDLWRFEPPVDGRVGGKQIEYGSESEDETECSTDDDETDDADSASSDSAPAELRYAGARGAFGDRRDFEPRRSGRSGGKGARDSRLVIAGGGSGRGRGGGRSGGGGRGRGRR